MATPADAPVTLLPPEAWQAPAQAAFDAVTRELALLLPDAQVQHMGATSVPGSWSKGDVDLAVLVVPATHAASVLRLQAAGYRVEADTLRTPELCMLRAPRTDLDLALQVLAHGSAFAHDFLRFRDALLASPALVARYNAIKTEHASAGMQAYRAAKSRFIAQVLSAPEPSPSCN